MIKKLFTHSFIYALGPQIPKFANILVLPIITPFLTSIDYGIYGALTSYVGMLSGLSELGLSVILVNTFYGYQQNDRWKFHWRKLYGLLAIWSFAYALLLCTVIYFVAPEAVGDENKFRIMTLLFLQSALFAGTNLIGGRLFQLSQQPTYISIVTVITGLITIAANLITIRYMALGYMGWYYSSFIGGLTMFIFYCIPIIKRYRLIPDIRLNRRYIKENLKVSLPTIPHSYSAYLLNSSDRMVMDQLNTPIDRLGVYNVGYSFGSYFNMVGAMVGMAQAPFMAKLWFKQNIESKLQIRNLVYLLQTGFIILAFLLALWSKEIIPLLYRNSDFAGAYVYAVIIIMSYVYFPLYWGWINKLFYEKKTKFLWRISFIAGVGNVILNLIFVPLFGPMAAALTTFVCLMYLAISGYFITPYKELNDVKYFPLRWLVLMSVMVVLAYVLKDASFLNKSIITVILLATSVALYKKFEGAIKGIEV